MSTAPAFARRIACACHIFGNAYGNGLVGRDLYADRRGDGICGGFYVFASSLSCSSAAGGSDVYDLKECIPLATEL
jgi:hypothetical protein